MNEQFKNSRRSYQMQSDGDNTNGNEEPKDPKPTENKPSGVIRPVPKRERNPKKTQ